MFAKTSGLSFYKWCTLVSLLLIPQITSAQNCEAEDLDISDEEATALRSSLKTGEITWVFDKEYETGRFANGDYWILGPVTIEEINPPFDGDDYGWEVNPIVDGPHGFDSDCYGDRFSASLVPNLPYVANPVDNPISIVKTTPTGGDYPCIKFAAVLTVVNEKPPQNGAAVFRPPYVGTEKPYYFVDDIKKELLPKYKAVSNMPTLEYIEKRFAPLQMDHKGGHVSRGLRPEDNMASYSPKNTPDQNEAVLRFMIDEPYENKKQALINFLQYGIDATHSVYLGQLWPDGGGHEPGHLIVLSFTATMLGIDKMKEILDTATFFHGTRWFYKGNNNITLFGIPTSEEGYWNYIMGAGGNRSQKDPYEYIDGGNASHLEYQNITTQSHKGEILAAQLMPKLKQAWPSTEFEMMEQYVDRWVLHGVWTQPDPFAPFDGNTSNYSVTYGDGIRGNGRFLENHGDHKDDGQYKSSFVEAMWNTYRKNADGAENISATVVIISPFDSSTISSSCDISITAFCIHKIDSIYLFLNGEKTNSIFTKGTSKYNEYISTVSNIPVGDNSISIQVIDELGNTTASDAINVTVQ